MLPTVAYCSMKALQLKDRNLHKALGSKGVEGEAEDDWQVVDCHGFLVHVLLPGW